jgi:glycerol-3-phosphate O-acyltransferase
MDVLGNFVNQDGKSFDRKGNPVDIKEYFSSVDGQLNEDTQREGEYTKILAERLVERYFVENVVLSSHLLAFTVFEILVHQNPKLDLFGLLRLPPEEYVFPFKSVVEVIEQLQAELFRMEREGRLMLSPEIHLPAEELIRDAMKKLGVFHRKKTLLYNKEGDIMSEDFRVLYYYHNRLENYGLDRKVHWKSEEIEVLKVD